MDRAPRGAGNELISKDARGEVSLAGDSASGLEGEERLRKSKLRPDSPSCYILIRYASDLLLPVI